MNQETTMDYDITDGAREYKAGLPAGDAQDVYDAMMRTFEHFKSENDDRLKAIEKRGGDVIAEEKVARIDAALNAHQQRLDELSLKGARPALSAEHAVRLHGAKERKSAFDAYIRSGESAGLRQIETKAMSVGSSPDGGYLVPEETEIEIGKRLNDISPMRSICALRAISGSIYRKPFMITGPATGWVGKTTARPQTASPVLDELSFPAMELYAMPAVTPTLLEDSAVNIDEWLAGEVELTLRDAGRRGFHQWRRQQQAEGLSRLRHPAECIVDLGSIGYVATGAAGAFPAANPSDVLIDLIYALRSGYRQNASFVMNRKTLSLVRRFKSSSGDYLCQPPAVAGGKSSLIGFPLLEAEDMPDVAANSLSVAFGDFRRGYLIVDRQGARVLRDPYSAKPYVLFYTTKRVGGGVQDFDAIKLLKFSAACRLAVHRIVWMRWSGRLRR